MLTSHEMSYKEGLLFIKPCNLFKTNGLMDDFCACLFSHLKYWKDLMAVSPIN